MKREAILEEANICITRDRHETHGIAGQVFKSIADLWSVYLGIDVTPNQAAMMMVLFKVARQKSNAAHMDNYIDACGYAAIAGEFANEMFKEVNKQ